VICVPVLVPVRVIHTSETNKNETFTVTHTSTNTCNSVAVKNLVKIVKYLEFLVNINSTVPFW